jgi:hypothetical protein
LNSPLRVLPLLLLALSCSQSAPECANDAACDDTNPCTTDSCSAQGTCVHANLAAGTSCDDGQFCNGADTCDAAGACAQHGASPCSGVCDETGNACVAAPVLDGFGASPTALSVGVPTSVTWTWTYSNAPYPAPTCTIDFGVGTLDSGATTSLSLTHARTYRLTCANNAGSATADLRLTVDECAGNAYRCDTHASCVNTDEGYSCSCNGGYTGSGDQCSAVVDCGTTPSLCDTNASCVGGAACVCKAGFVGNGQSCQRLHLAFVTSTTGTGNVSTWSGAIGTGLAAADSVCQARASTAGLPGTFQAWLSDSGADAYCRVHGLPGTQAGLCGGQSSLPASAGPWVRRDASPFAPGISSLLAPSHVTYYPLTVNENGTAVTSGRTLTGTTVDGVAATNTCSSWTSASTALSFTSGLTHGGGTSWTDAVDADTACNQLGRLICLETGAGPSLPPMHPAGKKVFVTSAQGTGNLSSWSDAGGQTGLAAADEICRTRARFMGFDNPGNYKALLSDSSASAASRLTSNATWHRPDGVIVATSKADLLDGLLRAPINVTEDGEYLAAAASQYVWTGTTASGVATASTCVNWTSAANSDSGGFGDHDRADALWVEGTTVGCDTVQRLYCFED